MFKESESPETQFNLKDEILGRFREKFPCKEYGCDGNGVIPIQTGEEDWEPQQCQFHAEFLFPLKQFLSDSLSQYGEYEYDKGWEDGFGKTKTDLASLNSYAQSKIEEKMPLDVSHWKNFGIKNGYWEYFKNEVLEEFKKELIDRITLEYDDPSPKALVIWEDTSQRPALDEIISLINSNK